MRKSYVHLFVALLILTTASQGSQLPEPEKASAPMPSSSLSQVAASHKGGGLVGINPTDRTITLEETIKVDSGRRTCPGHVFRKKNWGGGTRYMHCEPGCEIVWDTQTVYRTIPLSFFPPVYQTLGAAIAPKVPEKPTQTDSHQEGGSK